MKLYEIDWSIYPRRIGIYLSEKPIPGLERVQCALPSEPSKKAADGLTVAGTVPVLETGDGFRIGSSLAILEYLEERFPEPTMIGATPEERSRTREVLSVSEEATTLSGLWVHNASRLFAGREPQDKSVAHHAMAAFFLKLRLLDKMTKAYGGEFLAGSRLTIADCATFATLQTKREFFDVPVPDDCPHLAAWYARFAQRPSGAVPNYPSFVLQMTRGLLEHTRS